MRKKLIKTFGFIILSNVPLMTMAISSSTTSSSETTISQINQTFKTKLRTKFVNNWVTETKRSSNSNIIDGQGGVIFEDSQGNLWAMGKGTKLQKYDYSTNRWTEDNTSSITNGYGGIIFEDSRGNLWSMGYKNKNKSPLQKYNYSTNKWSEDSSSNITKGYDGVIFEDSRGNLWSMGSETPLQKYNYSNKQWVSSSGNNINDGQGGVIFEDSRGNLWSIGRYTKLQKYDYSAKLWTEETKENSNSNINNKGTGGVDGGVIFEDSQGNLWSAGYKSLFQKYNYNTKKWNVINSNFKNLFDSKEMIFEDSRGNLWGVWKWDKLKKYNYRTQIWDDINSNITNGGNGIIFEDSWGNLWSMGKGTPLQKYDYNTSNWSNVDENNNITDGEGGTIFEDSRGNLWSMGKGTPLQKLTSQNVPNVNNQKTKNFDITFTTRINADDRIAVLIKGYRKYTSDKFTHLKYKKKNESNWKIVKDKIMILDSADYEFKWIIGSEEHIASDSRKPLSFEVKNDGSIKENIITTNLIKSLFSIVGTNDNGTIKTQSSNLPSQVEPRYYVGLKPNPNNNEYTKVAPSNLSNDNKIKIKFFIKNEYINTHQFPTDFVNTPIEITVADLPEGTPVPTTNLRKKSFSIIGLNGVGTIKIKKGISLPPQVEVKYYIGLTLSSNNNDYTNKVPNKLSNDKKVWIKFFIKDQNINTHKFPNNFANTPIEIKVSGLNNKSSNKENSGATIGIIAGSIVGTLTLGVLAYYLIRSKKKKTK